MSLQFIKYFLQIALIFLCIIKPDQDKLSYGLFYSFSFNEFVDIKLVLSVFMSYNVPKSLILILWTEDKFSSCNGARIINPAELLSFFICFVFSAIQMENKW